MLKSIGAGSVDELFADIPASILLKKPLDLPAALSEMALFEHMKSVERSNAAPISLLGAGAYRHYIPAVVNHLAGRSEFYTAYTPYQPEVSQGTLTAIFEFQTMMCRLTGLDVANASMYDGATALAESIIMALRSNNRKKVVVSDAVHPNYREVIMTYCGAAGYECVFVASSGGVTAAADIERAIDSSTGAVAVQNPNFFGCIEDIAAVAEVAHAHNAAAIMSVLEPHSLALLKKPGALGIDIVCGEAQGFGNPIGFGGPMLGFIAAKNDYMRKIPGRLVGKTTDDDGREAYVLTLQTREQHIRRDRATSNICTNEGLCALRAVIYLSYYGNKLRDLALYNHKNAVYVKNLLIGKGFTPVFTSPFFNEFVVHFDNMASVYEKFRRNGVVPGLLLGDYYPELDDCLLVSATECLGTGEIEHMMNILEKI